LTQDEFRLFDVQTFLVRADKFALKKHESKIFRLNLCLQAWYHTFSQGVLTQVGTTGDTVSGIWSVKLQLDP